MLIPSPEVELPCGSTSTSSVRNPFAPSAAVRLTAVVVLPTIDCPPSLGIITLNAFTACDTLLIPIQCEYYALEGLSQLMATLRQVKRLYNPNVDIEGVLLTMYDSRLNPPGQYCYLQTGLPILFQVHPLLLPILFPLLKNLFLSPYGFSKNSGTDSLKRKPKKEDGFDSSGNFQ